MSANKQRRPMGRVLYIVFWVGAVWCGLGFLGNLPTIISGFLRNYAQDKAMAFEYLVGQLIVGAIAVFCILEIVDAIKARKQMAAEVKRDNASLDPVSAPSSPFGFENPTLLNGLKEELFTLETENLSGKIPPEQYAEARAALEYRMKLATGATVLDSSIPVPSEPEQEQSPTVQNKTSLWITEPILAVLCVTAFFVYLRYPLSAETAGYMVGSLLIPFLIAYAIAGAKRRRNWVLFWCLFIGIAIILPGARNQKSLQNLSRSDMWRELAGTKPLDENLPENEKEMATATKAIFADMRAFEKSQNEHIEALKPELEKIYTSESFSSKEAMQRAMDALSKALSLDRETESMLKRMPESVKTRLDQTKLSDTEKSSFYKSFMASFNDPESVSARNQVIITESDWADSVHDLYTFSLQHSSQIVVSKEGISIANKAIREKFNEKITRSNGLRSNFLAATKKADEIRTAGFKNQGISPADMGLDK